MQTEYHAVNKTGLYSLALKECLKKATADKTWASFKQFFVEEYHYLVEENKVINRDADFHSTNVMQEIVGSINHLAMAEVSDKDIVANLTEAVETITINNASLTTQLSNTMKINLDMDKKLNLKGTQIQEPEEKILNDIARKKAAFERNLDQDG